DFHVTGVQTCALPISGARPASHFQPVDIHNLFTYTTEFAPGTGMYAARSIRILPALIQVPAGVFRSHARTRMSKHAPRSHSGLRSEERRVGEACVDGG